MKHFRTIILAVVPQLLILLIMTGFLVLSKVGMIPSAEALGSLLEDYFHHKGGLIIVVLFAFVENIVGVNTYFPGSIVLLTAMATTAGEPTRAFLVFFYIAIPSLAAQFFNYGIGRAMNHWRSTDMNSLQPRIALNASVNASWVVFIATFWHPHLAAVTSIAAGKNDMPVGMYALLSISIGLFWYTFWAFVMYHFGVLVKETSIWIFIAFGYVCIWMFWDIARMMIKLKRLRTKGDGGIKL